MIYEGEFMVAYEAGRQNSIWHWMAGYERDDMADELDG